MTSDESGKVLELWHVTRSACGGGEGGGGLGGGEGGGGEGGGPGGGGEGGGGVGGGGEGGGGEGGGPGGGGEGGGGVGGGGEGGGGEGGGPGGGGEGGGGVGGGGEGGGGEGGGLGGGGEGGGPGGGGEGGGGEGGGPGGGGEGGGGVGGGGEGGGGLGGGLGGGPAHATGKMWLAGCARCVCACNGGSSAVLTWLGAEEILVVMVFASRCGAALEAQPARRRPVVGLAAGIRVARRLDRRFAAIRGRINSVLALGSNRRARVRRAHQVGSKEEERAY